MTSGSRQAPEQGSWQVPGSSSSYQPVDEGGRVVGRGRPAVVALVVALTELVIIAAAGNHAVTKHAARYSSGHPGFPGHVVASSLEFAWRLTPQAGDDRGYAGQLVTIGVLVVLSALLAAVAVRGPVTFWRAFFGVWTAAVAAACVGRAAGAFGTGPRQGGTDSVTDAVFNSVTGETAFAGAVIGLLTAVVAALCAVASRRTVERPAVAAAAPEPAYVPETPPPFYGNTPGGGGQWTPPAGSGQPEGESTQAMPATPDDERRG